MADRVTARVVRWGQAVGTVAEENSGQVVFQYDSAFRRSGLEISPLHLPLSLAAPVTFPALRHVEMFRGLPGVLADGLPDRFGSALIGEYFRRAGTPEKADRPIESLRYIGRRAMGALEFLPALDVGPIAEQSIPLPQLVDEARVVVQGSFEVAVPIMMHIGASAGGARPKALVLWNRDTNQVRSAFATPRLGEEPWLLKFDGVGQLDTFNPHSQPHTRSEYAYMHMARAAGIATADVALLPDRRLHHLLVKRFDRGATGRLHYHSLGGLVHTDYNAPGAYSYERYLLVCRELGLAPAELDDAFRRAVFNIAAVNQDDHVKNFGFLMNRDGHWSLAPAFDLTYAHGMGFTRRHQMTLNGKTGGFTRDDLLALGRSIGLREDGALAIDRVLDAIGDWPKFATDAGVPAEPARAIGAAHRCPALTAAR
ncbi:MAG: type II toxin-antitoxin system HipA family toxin [Gemmatimonadaceae bacterium]